MSNPGIVNFANTGKPAGSKNKFSTLKEAFLEAFYHAELGGVEGLVQWAIRNNENRTHFYKFIVQLLPKDINLKGDSDAPLATKVVIEVKDGSIMLPEGQEMEHVTEITLPDDAVRELATQVIRDRSS